MPGGSITVLLTVLVLVLGVAGCSLIADRREAGWEAESPPVGRLLSVEGRQVHVLEAGQPRGSAPDLVLIHGANGNLRDFTHHFIDRIAGDWRVIAVDRPGLGWSESWGAADSDPRLQARVLREAVAELGVERPLVLGHSYGGAVALAWALEAEDETAGLLLLAPASHPWPGSLGLWYRVNETPLGRAGRALLAAITPEWLAERVVAGVFEPDPMPPGYAAHFGTGLALRRSSQAANARQVNALLEHVSEMQAGYAGLTLPIEVVHGDADEIVGLPIHSERLAAEVEAAELTVIPGGGHMPHHSHPEVVLDALERGARRAGLR